MRALQMTGYQQAPELREVAEPEPGPGEVVVRVGAAGACHSDLHLLHEMPEGLLPWELPSTLGHENAGWVEALGVGVNGVEVGQPVAVYGPLGCGHCQRCLAGMQNYCVQGTSHPPYAPGLGMDGGMAPLLLVPDARRLVPIGDLDPVQAAPLTDAGLTPYHAIARSRHLLVPGSHVVVIGVGGLGHLAVQLLEVLTSATVIAVDAKPEALALAASAGVEHAIAAGDLAAFEVLDATKGAGAELTLDFVGTEQTLALAAAVTRSLGHVTLVGIAGGTFPFGYFSAGYEVSFASTYWGSITELVEVLALAQRGLLRAHVEAHPLADAVDVYDRLHRGDITGRAVLVP